MPEVCFTRTAPRTVARSRARWTVTGSIALHAVLVLAILVAPVLGSPVLPPFTRPLVVIYAESIPVPPPPPAPAPRSSVTEPAGPPTEAPEGLRKEPPPVVAGPESPGVPGGMDLPVGKDPGVLVGARGTPPMTVTPPKPQGPVRPGGDVLPPTRTTYVAPVYPAIAIQAKRDGTVVLEAVIDETGTVRDVTVLRSVPLLDRAAIDAVRQWRYSPTRLNGVPVAIIMTVTVTFTLK